MSDERVVIDVKDYAAVRNLMVEGRMLVEVWKKGRVKALYKIARGRVEPDGRFVLILKSGEDQVA